MTVFIQIVTEELDTSWSEPETPGIGDHGDIIALDTRVNLDNLAIIDEDISRDGAPVSLGDGDIPEQEAPRLKHVLFPLNVSIIILRFVIINLLRIAFLIRKDAENDK